jgi:flagellin-specific chaperone FliS
MLDEIKNKNTLILKEEETNTSEKILKKQPFIKKCTFELNIDEINNIKDFFSALYQGSPEDILYIKNILKNDPKKNLRGPKDLTRMGNITNFNKEFPLYIASKNNNIKIIKILYEGLIQNKLILRKNKSSSTI